MELTNMDSLNSFDAAASAYETVRITINGLQKDYTRTCIEIGRMRSDLGKLPLSHIPLDDLKAGILEFIDAAGSRYAKEHIEGAISSFAKNQLVGTAYDPALSGKPLRFCDMESIVGGGNRDYMTQLATPSKSMFDDRALYCFFAPLVKSALTAIMAGMAPEQFGYDQIHPDKIGSDRAARRKAIDALTTELNELEAKRLDLRSKLLTLGVAPSLLQNVDTAQRIADATLQVGAN